MSSARLKRKATAPVNNYSRYGPGSLIELRLVNFMCHAHLRVEFAPRVNLILGANGTGKSAIMNALTLCLGGRATQTLRDVRGVNSFIKSGERFSDISVVLRNGERSGTHGSTITITRRILRSPDDKIVSKYRLEDENNGLVSTSMFDIRKILDEFNIELDNPVCMLSQQMAKQFMTNQGPREMYGFFERMTGLVRGNEELDEMEKKIGSVSGVISDRKSSLDQKKKEQEKCELIIQSEQLLESCVYKQNSLRGEIMWTEVVNMKRGIDKKKEMLDNYNSCMPALQERISEFQAKVDQIDCEAKAAEAKLAEISGQVQTKQTDYQSAKEGFRSDEIKISLISQELQDKDKEIMCLCDELEKIEQNISNSCSTDPNRLELLKREKLELDELIGRTLRDLEVEQERERSLEETKKQLCDEFEMRKHELQMLHNKLSSDKHSLKSIERDGDEDFVRFGYEMPSLLSGIKQNARYFKEMPIGPLGTHLDLVDSSWRESVEKAIGKGLLCSFICANYSDERQLRRIMMEVYKSDRGRMPQIIVQKAIRGPLTGCRKGFRSCKSIYGVLNFKNPGVELALVDIGRIDCVLLIERRDDAFGMLRDVAVRSAGFKKAFIRDGSEIVASEDGSLRCYKEPSFPSILSKQDRQARVGQLNQLITQLTDSYETKRNELRLLKDKINEISSNSRQNTTTTNLEAFIEQNKKRVVEIDLELMETHGGSHQLNFFQQEASSLRASIERLKSEKEAQSLEHSNFAAIISENKRRMEHLHDEYLNLKDRRQKVEKDMSENALKRADLMRGMNETGTMLENIVKKCRKGEVEISEMDEKLADLERSAIEETNQASCPENLLIRTVPVSQLEEEVKALGDKIEQLRRKQIRNQTREQVEERLSQLSLQIELSQSMIERDAGLFELLTTMLNERRATMHDFRDGMATRCRYKFERFLSCRNMRGSLDFDHEAKKLLISIRPVADIETSTKQRDLSTLSGGERSYGTVCLLIAMWSVSKNPFRFMDEYDVFMDCVNRSVATTLLLEAAAEATGTQFLFMTPLTTDGINLPEENELNKIVRIEKQSEK